MNLSNYKQTSKILGGRGIVILSTRGIMTIRKLEEEKIKANFCYISGDSPLPGKFSSS